MLTHRLGSSGTQHNSLDHAKTSLVPRANYCKRPAPLPPNIQDNIPLTQMFDAQKKLADDCEVMQLLHVGKQSITLSSSREEAFPVDSSQLSSRFSNPVIPKQSQNGQIKQMQNSSWPRIAYKDSLKTVNEVQPKDDFKSLGSHSGSGSRISFNGLALSKTLENHKKSWFSTSYDYQNPNSTCTEQSVESVEDSSFSCGMYCSQGEFKQFSIVFVIVYAEFLVIYYGLHVDASTLAIDDY
jgi:hypothetical protein